MFRKINDSGGPVLTLTIDGQAVTAQAGEIVAAVLLRQPAPASRSTPVQGSPRAPYCMMGVCFDCLAIVDGAASAQTCLVAVREGMRVERQFGRQSVAPQENAGPPQVFLHPLGGPAAKRQGWGRS